MLDEVNDDDENDKNDEEGHNGEGKREGILTWRASTGAISIGSVSVGSSMNADSSEGTSLSPGVGCGNPDGV